MIIFIGGRSGKGWQLYMLSDDDTDVRPLTDFPRGAFLLAPLRSPDGKSLAFTYKENYQSPYTQVCTIDVDSREVRPLLPADRQRSYFALQWLPDGTIVYQEMIYPQAIQSRPIVEIYLSGMAPDGSRQQRLFDLAHARITFSPDGTRMARVAAADGGLSIARADGTDPVAVENGGAVTQRVAWAPDGIRLAFSSQAPRSHALIYAGLSIVDRDGANPQRLGRIVAESAFSVSPDGRQVVALGAHKREFTIDIIGPQTQKVRTIATVEGDPQSGNLPSHPVWSPDGRYVLYETFVDPYVHLLRADPATGESQPVVGDEGEFVSVNDLSWY